MIVLAPAVVLSRLSWHWGVKAPLCLGLVFAVGGFGGTALERMARRPHSRRQRFVEALLFYAPMLIGLKGGIDGMTPGAVISGFLMGALYAAMWAGSEDDNQTPWWWWRRRHAATREVGR
ncbi:MAG: hypothetical protein R2694_12545 [Ilumatobacteraceae bacterium]